MVGLADFEKTRKKCIGETFVQSVLKYGASEIRYSDFVPFCIHEM